MSRARLYMLIEAFEADNRALVEKCLLDHLDPHQVFSDQELKDARWRQDREGGELDVSIVHYLDLKPVFDSLIRGKHALPEDLKSEVVSMVPPVASLVPIRNRVMHGRPLRIDDPAIATTLLTGFSAKYWPDTAAVLNRLIGDPAWEPFIERKAVPFERTLHNLPEPDYDETTFIGRKAEADRLLRDLQNKRYPVVTLTGEGGIGKTALALDVAYRLIDSEDNPYEVVLWVSLKTEQLTAHGIRELRDAVSAIDGTIDALGRGISDDFAGTVADLSDALEGIDALVIIDNLETVNGEEVVSMIDALPASICYLFTSRVGLGQLERRLPLPPLHEDEAKLLFRKFASTRGQTRLAGLSATALHNVVEGLRRSPLAIRWYVLSSEAGKIPLDVLKNQDILLKFCVENVYERLTEKSQAILSVLRALDRSIGFDEFAILTDLGIDDLRAGTQELTRGALVVVEAQTAGSLASRLALTPTARAFLARPDHKGTFIAEVLRRERDFKASLENAESKGERIDERQVWGREDSDQPAVFLLRSAIKFASWGQSSRAQEQVDRAKSFNPEFSEVHRISGYLQSQEGHYEAALSDYKTALSYASGDETIATTSYVLADLLATKLHTAHLAIEHARNAYKHKPCGDTAFLLGKILVWAQEFEEGQTILVDAREALNKKGRVRATTVLADSWGRWAEQDLKKHQHASAIEKATAGYHLARQALDEYPGDVKLVEVLAECSIQALRGWTRNKDPYNPGVEQKLERVVASIPVWAPLLRGSRKFHYLREALEQAAVREHRNRNFGLSLTSAARSLAT